MKAYTELIRRLGRTRGFTWVASRALPPIDARFRDRRTSLTTFGTEFPLCYLTTIGRRTGRSHTVPLLYVEGDGRIAVVASNWGRPNHPAWSLNLDATPTATITIRGVERPVRGRRATAAEERALWPRALEVYPGYGDYRRRAGRDVRLFVLEPESDAAG